MKTSTKRPRVAEDGDCTGLTDANGNRIHVGDTMRVLESGTHRMAATNASGSMEFVATFHIELGFMHPMLDVAAVSNHCVVVRKWCASDGRDAYNAELKSWEYRRRIVMARAESRERQRFEAMNPRPVLDEYLVGDEVIPTSRRLKDGVG